MSIMEENTNLKEEITLDNNQKAKRSILGFIIGLAIIIPGISGSTVAIIFKLYDKMIYALGNLFSKFKKCILFLLPIGVFAFVGVLIGFFTIQKLLDLIPFILIALFAGMMLGSYPAVLDEIKGEKFTKTRIVLFILGLILPVILSVGSVFLNNNNASAESLLSLNFFQYILLFVLGYIVAITQVIPGLSATAILLALGYFRPIMDSVHFTFITENPQIILVYIMLVLGFLVGLLTFTKLLSKLFVKKRTTTFFLIIGLSLGSIISMFYNPDISIIYNDWASGASNINIHLPIGIICFILGVIVTYQFVKFERKHNIKAD